MRVFDQQEADFSRDAAAFTVGALGGLAIGMLLSRGGAPRQAAGLGSELRGRVRSAGYRAREAARSMRPARLRRLATEQADLHDLEDRVIDAFLGDSVLSERGIDVGAISSGIIELSGSVLTEDEADMAVRIASTIPGVRTVVNRMDLERETGSRRRDEEGEPRWSGRMIGMNRRRQGRQTEPDRPDDSQHQEENALEHADRTQWQEEGLAAHRPRNDARPEVQSPWRTRYDEDELDNQDPHGKHAPVTLDEQPQELNASERVDQREQ